MRDYATKVIDRVVADYGVGYIKMDYNIDAGLGTEIDADSFGDGLLEHNRAYLDWIRSIKQKYPDLIVRVTGFSAKFISLSPEWQQEVLTRNFYE